MRHEVDTLVIGAGPAGLAVAACLKKPGVPFLVVDRATAVASSWRRHYDRLHLHTDRDHLALPCLSFPAGTPRYPSRGQVIEYLEQYARHFELAPHFSEEVQTVRPGNSGWITTTTASVYHSRRVVVATGFNAVPHLPRWPGQERFGDHIVHSSEYRNGEPFRGLSVLVVGFGNSGGEIAIDLHEVRRPRGDRGARPGEHHPPRDPRPARTRHRHRVEPLARTLRRRARCAARAARHGRHHQARLPEAPDGPHHADQDEGTNPLIDIGTIELIHAGHIEVLGDVCEMSGTEVRFDDGRSRRFDAIVAATGFRPRVDRFLELQNDIFDAERISRSGLETQPGLYFCAFSVLPTGMLREIGIEAQRIADDITRL